jgi:Fe2+ transport system protein FeoA
MGIPQIKAPDTGANICRPTSNRRILKYDQHGRIYRFPLFGGQRSGVRQVSVLSELAVGQTGVLVALDLPESVQNHLMHMGFVPDALVTALRRAPAGDPTVYGIDGMEIALRHETASAIRVRIAEPGEIEAIETDEPEVQIPDNVHFAEVAQ